MPNGGIPGVLGTLGGRGTEGFGVNSAGQVTGYSHTAAGEMHAFLTDPNGGALRDLGTLGGNGSQGDAVNCAGQVVGTSLTSGTFAVYDAFVWTGGRMLDLNSLVTDNAGGLHLSEATGISDTGLITGYGRDSAGRTVGFLLTPNPVNTGPKLTVTATASPALNGRRQISLTITNSGGGGADGVRITGVTLNASPPPSALPTAPSPLSPGQSQNDAFLFSPPGTGRQVLRVRGDYTDPATGAAGQFSGTVRLNLP